MAETGVVVPAIGLRVRRSWIWHVWVFCRQKPLGAVGAMLLILLGLTALLAPVIATHDPIIHDVPNRLQSPGREFPFGTDIFGRDQYSRIVHGARVSLYVGLISVTTSTVLGTLLGIISGYLGGRFDLFVQRLVDIVLGIPSIVLILALIMALGPSLNNVTIAIAVSFTTRTIRVARSQALTVKEDDFVLAARAIGASTPRIILRHVTVNSLTPSIVVGAGLLGSAIIVEAALSFLGLGVPPPHPSWGRMLQAGAQGYQEFAPWLTIFPGLALTIAVFGFNLFGDAIRDTLDPKLRGR